MGGYAIRDLNGRGHGWLKGTRLITLLGGLGLLVIEALILGIVSAWPGRVGAWLAAYAGVVLGSTLFLPLISVLTALACAAEGGYHAGWFGTEWTSCPPPSTAIDLLAGAAEALSLAAPTAGVLFLVAGGIAVLLRAAFAPGDLPPPAPGTAVGLRADRDDRPG